MREPSTEPPHRISLTTNGALSSWVIQGAGLLGMVVFGLYWMVTQLAPPVFVFAGFGTLVAYGQVKGAREKLRADREGEA